MAIEINPDLTPVTILVTQNEWAAVDDLTPRNILLTQIITDMGGISDTVPPGTYKFNAVVIKDQIHVTLDPA